MTWLPGELTPWVKHVEWSWPPAFVWFHCWHGMKIYLPFSVHLHDMMSRYWNSPLPLQLLQENAGVASKWPIANYFSILLLQVNAAGLYSLWKTSWVPGQRWNPKYKAWECDNVRAIIYHIPQRMVMDEHEAMAEWWLPSENQRNWERTCSSATFSTTNIRQ